MTKNIMSQMKLRENTFQIISIPKIQKKHFEKLETKIPIENGEKTLSRQYLKINIKYYILYKMCSFTHSKRNSN